MTPEDVYATLQYENMIRTLDAPPPLHHTPSSVFRRGRGRGRSRLTAPRRSTQKATQEDPDDDSEPKVVIPKRYIITWDREYVEALLHKHDSRGYLELAPERLKYHPFLVTRHPIKPPGSIAKAALVANNPNSAGHVDPEVDELASSPGDGENQMDVEEDVQHGEDRATLDLVQALAHESPQRSLRHRTSSELNSRSRSAVRRLRPRDTASADKTTPTRRSMRGTRSLAVMEVDMDQGKNAGSTELMLRNGHDHGDPFYGEDMDRIAVKTASAVTEELAAVPIPASKRAAAVIAVDEGEESDDPLRLVTPKKRHIAIHADSPLKNGNGLSGGMGGEEDAEGEEEEVEEEEETVEQREEDRVDDLESLGEDDDAEGESEDAEGEEEDADGEWEQEGGDEDAEGEDDEDYVE